MSMQGALTDRALVRLSLALTLVASCTTSGAPVPVTRSSTQVIDGRLECDLVFRLGEESFQAGYGGELVLSSDEDEVVTMGPGAYLIVEQLDGLQRRRSVWSRAGDGAVNVDDFLDRRRVVGDTARDVWRSRMLQTLVGATDLGGEARRERFRTAGSTGAILDHLERRTQGRFAVAYLPLILADPQLEDSELVEVVARATRITESSTALAALLAGLAGRTPQDERFTAALFRASEGVASSSARSEVLVAILEARELSGVQLGQLISEAGALKTAASAAYVLSAVVEQAPDPQEWGSVWLAAVHGLSSSAMRAGLYRALLRREGLHAEVRLDLARALAGVSPSSTRVELMLALSPSAGREPQLFDALLVLTEELSLSSERARSVRALLANTGLSERQLQGLRGAAETISAQGTRRELQGEILERLQREE